MKKIIKKTLMLLVIISFILLTFSFSIKEIILSSLSTIVTNNIVAKEINNIVEKEASYLGNASLNKVKESINNSDELNKITEVYFDNIIVDILNDTTSKPNIKENINRLIDESLPSEYSNYKGIINESINKINFDNIYTNLLDYVKNIMNTTLKSVISVYNILTSINTKILLSIFIILALILVVILNKSILKSFEDFSKILNGVAVTQIILSLLIKVSMRYLDLKYIIVISIIELLIAFILSTIYSKKYDE